MQTGPLLAPDIVQEFLVPEYRRLFDFYRQRGVLLVFHSCGRVDWLLEALIELGVDLLEPVQASANDLTEIRRITRGRLALQGGVSTATVMAGPAKQIVAEARERMWQLGREGGHFCCPDQGSPSPPTHVDALRQAVVEHGRYPLSPPDAP